MTTHKKIGHSEGPIKNNYLHLRWHSDFELSTFYSRIFSLFYLFIYLFFIILLLLLLLLFLFFSLFIYLFIFIIFFMLECTATGAQLPFPVWVLPIIIFGVLLLLGFIAIVLIKIIIRILVRSCRLSCISGLWVLWCMHSGLHWSEEMGERGRGCWFLKGMHTIKFMKGYLNVLCHFVVVVVYAFCHEYFNIVFPRVLIAITYACLTAKSWGWKWSLSIFNLVLICCRIKIPCIKVQRWSTTMLLMDGNNNLYFLFQMSFFLSYILIYYLSS